MIIAKIITYVFHPVFMPILGLFIIFNSGVYPAEIPQKYIHAVYLVVFLCYVVLPLSIIPGLMVLGRVQNIKIDTRTERFIPLFFAAICFYLGYYIVSRFSQSSIINLFLLASVVVVIIVLFCSLFWKISIHMAGIGGITGLVLFFLQVYDAGLIYFLCTSILLAGVIASSRLALSSHTPFQIIVGYLLGGIVVYGFIWGFAIYSV